MPWQSTPTETPRISLKPDERWIYLGDTGTGKSHLARANLRVMEVARWRICIIEPDGMWLGKTGRPAKSGPGTVDCPRLVDRFNPKLQVQWFVPTPPVYIDQDERLRRFLLDIMAAGDTVVYFDEITQLVNQHHQDPAFTTLWTQGRKHNIAGWASTQYPTRIADQTLSQANNWAAFRVSKPAHAKLAAEYMASPLLAPESIHRARLLRQRGEPADSAALNQLPVRYWYYFHKGEDGVMDHAQLMAPIPKGGWPGYERRAA
jgi:hypothetical protein